MIKILSRLYDNHFNKLLLAFLFIGIVILVIHLMNKSDAGGDDQAFILWATNTASLVMGKLLGMMLQDKPEPPPNTAIETKTITTATSPDPNVKETT
jgi:hypothetical protein